MSAKAQAHIRALKRMAQELSWAQLDEIYFLVGNENKRRQDLQEQAASKQSPPP